MPRYKLTIEYDGTPYLGWQVQDEGTTVQGRLAQAITAFTGETVLPYGAGRTDSGVHATGQIAHIDLAQPREPFVIRNAINNHLAPEPISVLDAEAVDATFDARFSATQRHYLYRIWNRPAFLALEQNRAWYVPQPLNEAAMHESAQALVGRHDFTTFRSVHCGAKSPVKRLSAITVTRNKHMIIVTVSAPSFMHNQVRSIVGSLKQVGIGKWPVTGIATALAACDRAACGPVAPSAGLYLTGVDYAAAEVSADENVAK
ncbi:MAG: tRNA pseudouridine(38-40) synthase TruA [Pseudomonadota bacterium]